VTFVPVNVLQIIQKQVPVDENHLRRYSVVFRLDYVSCVLTIASTVLVGRHHWQGWVLGTLNGVIMCIIGVKTAQLGFIPANLFCMALSCMNIREWRRQRPATM
jgi:hypothetical protein